MTDDAAIRVINVSKKYRLYPSRSYRLREALDPFRRAYHREFWALKDITFEIPRGHTVGILGLNGSGKSTLLQIISFVLQPTSGTVEVNGKVAALLGLGVGFNPDLTGRENVILHGTIMGLRRDDILARMDDVEAFADIGEFFDQPMKTYSSGMFMRVAFSAAIHIDPEVLITDEVLAVGDAKFQEKCFRRFRGLQDAGKTILFVTHDRSAVPRHCNMGMLLHKGQLLEIGPPGRIADLYGEILAFGRLQSKDAEPRPTHGGITHPPVAPQQAQPQGKGAVPAFIKGDSREDHCWRNPTYNKYEHRFGNRHAAIIDYMIVDQANINPPSIRSGNRIDVYLKVLFHQEVQQPIVGMILKNKEGVIVYGVNTHWMKIGTRPGSVGRVQCYYFSVQLNLCAGDWFMDLAVAESTTDLCDNRSALAHVYLTEERQYTGLAWLDARFAEVEPNA